MLRVTPSAELEDLVKLLRNSPEVRKRIQAIERAVAFKTAERVRDDVKAKAPRDPKLKPYVEALDVSDIDGHPNAVALTAELKQELATVNTAKTVALFPNTPGEAVFPVLAILRQYEPWAIDMIPPVTVKDVVFREVTEQEVKKARAANVLILPSAMSLLTQAKVPMGDEFKVKGSAMLDLANLALRIEFGAPGVPRAMHWRPGVKKAMRGLFVKVLARDSQFKEFVAKTLFDAGFGGYKQETPPTYSSITEAQAKRFEDFQKRLT